MSFGYFGPHGEGDGDANEGGGPMEMDMGMGTDFELEDEDPDRRPTTLLGRIRRFFDRGGTSDSRWHDWWNNHPAGDQWSGWGGGGGCGSGGCCGGGGCGGGGCGSC